MSNNKQLIRFDWAIKTILRNKVNFPILEGFLSELLRTKVVIQSLLESESNKESSDDKSNRVDVLAQLKGDEKVIIEVQCVHQYEWLRSRRIEFAEGKAQRASNRGKVASQWDFLSRMLYGVSKVVVEHLKQGDRYEMV